jgi:hypothetical protein
MSGEAARLAYLLVSGAIAVLGFTVALVKALAIFILHLVAWLLIYIMRAAVMLPLHHVARGLAWCGLVFCGRCLDRVATTINRSTMAVAQMLNPH